MIELRTRPGEKILELGGGDNPNAGTTCNVDIREGPKVNFTLDFEQFPWPIQSDEWDGVFSSFCLEHISFPNVPKFLAEVFRITKPGGKIVFVVPNTEAQMKWIQEHSEGWDNKDGFISCSELLYGSQSYNDNFHCSFFSPSIATRLFTTAGFVNVLTQPYNERGTDMVIEAIKPAPQVQAAPQVQEQVKESEAINISREEMFDRHYFGGGGKVGGYAREGYWDYPVHHLTAGHILARKPSSVLEIGCARGYVLKRIQDAGIPGYGLEISKHCYMTRVADCIREQDICKTPWGSYWMAETDTVPFDLCYSIAVLEHIPEEFLPAMIQEMRNKSKRGLHGIDFGGHDDGFDKTHCTLKPKQWWVDLFNQHAPGWPVEIVDKEELEKGNLPDDVIAGTDGKIKLNVGSFITMTHHGWLNIDIHNLNDFARNFKYNFMQRDVRQGLPFETGSVELIVACHFLEHLNQKEGLAFLRECRRVLKPQGAMRIIVPDAGMLQCLYVAETRPGTFHFEGVHRLSEFDHINEGCANAKTAAGKLWALLHEGHSALYDADTLRLTLTNAGFSAMTSKFRHASDDASLTQEQRDNFKQIQVEAADMLPCLSLFCDAVPKIA